MASNLSRNVLIATLLFGAPLVAADRPKADSNSAAAPTAVSSVNVQAEETKPCHWWQFRSCKNDENAEVTLPPEASRTGSVIAVDTNTNTLYLFRDGEIVARGPVATGTEKTLTKGSKVWMFHTPRGRLTVLRKIDDPVWRKPDWAFVEAGQKVPPIDSPKRLVKGHLGKYALDLGDGILIHGTKEADSLGRKASHGCVRVGDELLQQLYDTASVGTEVYIF